MTEPRQPMAPTGADRPATHADDASERPPELVGSTEPAGMAAAAGAARVDPDEGAALADDDRLGEDEADDEAEADAEAEAVDTGTMTDPAMAGGGTVGRVQVRRRFGRTTQPAAAPTVSEVAVKIQDRTSQIYVGVVVAIFAAILLNALFLGHGGLFAPKPTASPLPSASAAPASAGPASAAPSASAGPSASAAPASAGPSAGPSASATP